MMRIINKIIGCFGYPLLFILSMLLLVSFKYFKSWKLMSKVSRISEAISQFTHRWKSANDSLEEKRLQRIQRLLVRAIVLTPVQTVCMERSLMASIIFSLCGIKTKLVYGVRFRPYYMHIWIETEEGRLIFDSPREKKAFKRLGEVKHGVSNTIPT